MGSRRLVDLLPVVAQRVKTLTDGDVGSTWVVGREFNSHVHHGKSEFPHVENLKNTNGSPEIGTACWCHASRPVYPVRSRGGGCCEA